MSEERDDPSGLAELGRELREQVGEEFRAEAEETERLAAVAARRGRDLRTVGTELRDRGDRVAVDVSGRTYLGTVTYVGEDFIQIHATTPTAGSPDDGAFGGRRPHRVIDVNLAAPIVLRVVERVDEGGVGPGPGPATLRARLLELELAGAEVDLTGLAVAGAVRGRIEGVARDHVILIDRDGTRWYVPTATITTVRTRG